MENKYKYNVSLTAKRNEKFSGFDIYINYLGNSEYLMHHRHNEILFSKLKDGIAINELERCKQRLVTDVCISGRMSRLKTRKNYSQKIENSINHLINVANEYLEDMEQVA